MLKSVSPIVKPGLTAYCLRDFRAAASSLPCSSPAKSRQSQLRLGSVGEQAAGRVSGRVTWLRSQLSSPCSVASGRFRSFRASVSTSVKSGNKMNHFVELQRLNVLINAKCFIPGTQQALEKHWWLLCLNEIMCVKYLA